MSKGCVTLQRNIEAFGIIDQSERDAELERQERCCARG